MELDALYADVIVDRWQKLTGKEAVLEGTQKTFAQVREERIGAPSEPAMPDEVR
jgi:hypothetical protein